MSETARHFMRDALLPAVLMEMANSVNADKGDVPGLTGHPHRYAPIYEQYLQPIRDRPIHLLEIGVFRGASLRLWEQYLPNARIVGVDIDSDSLAAASARAHVSIGNATNRDFIRGVVRDKLDGIVDIVVDDGSHNLGDQLAAFENLFPLLSEGGLYFMEDIVCGRFAPWNEHDRGFSDFYDFAAWLTQQLTYFPNDNFESYHSITDPRLLGDAAVRALRSPWNEWVHQVSMYHNMCVISKARRFFPYDPAALDNHSTALAAPTPEIQIGEIRKAPGAASKRIDGAGAANRRAARPSSSRPIRRFFTRLKRSFLKRYGPMRRDFVRAAIEMCPTSPKRKLRLWSRASSYFRWLPGARPPGVQIGGKYDVVVLANIDYLYTGTHRPHHIAQVHARMGHRVFYILATPILSSKYGVAYEARRLSENLYRITVCADAFDHYGGIIEGNALEAFRSAIRQLALDWRIADAVVHVHLPSWTNLAFQLRQDWLWPVIYDCMDEWQDFPGIGAKQLQMERQLITEADGVAVTSRPLRQKCEPLAKQTALIRNGVDYSFFVNETRPNSSFDFRHPTIGFYGTIAEWVDLELIRQIADANPQWQFVIAGKSFLPDRGGLDACENVTILDQLPYSSMPALLWHFDVALIPFKLNSMTDAVNPVKLHEYLAGGKPVVATPIKELEDYADVLEFGDDAASLQQAIVRAMETDSTDRAAKRREVASRADWQARYDEFDAMTRRTLPSVSIVIVTFNNLKISKLCLDSVLANTTLPELEVIVVDNGSTDGTPEFVRTLAQRDARVRFISNTANVGFAAANNQGLTAAHGSVLVLLNNDVVVPRGWLRGLLRLLQDSSVGLVGPVTNAVGNEARVEYDYLSLAELDDFAIPYMAGNIGIHFDISMLAMYCVAMRRDVWETIGPLDEAYGLGLFEDDDYSNRVRQAGLKVVCTRESYVHHFGQASFKKLIPTGEYDELWKRNQAYYESKWGSWTPHKSS
jgi:GT2 family glycosyltransferase/glycosyltransferase involved in cell wall biosynthesis/SAM-dependent methyltransferase